MATQTIDEARKQLVEALDLLEKLEKRYNADDRYREAFKRAEREAIEAARAYDQA